MHTKSHTGLSPLHLLLIMALIGSISVSCVKGHSGVAAPNSAGASEVKPQPVTDSSSASPASSPQGTPVIIPVTPVGSSAESATAAPSGAVSEAGTEARPKSGQPMKIATDWQVPATAAKLVSPVKNSPDAAQIGRAY